MGLRICSMCRQEKNESEFVKSSYKKSGYASYCKLCNREKGKDYYHNRGGKNRKREYFIDNRDKILNYFSSRPFRVREYDKLKSPARSAVFRAIRRGILIRPDRCQRCGNLCKPDAHHKNGYNPESRLDVSWLCRSCHSLVENPDFEKVLMERNHV